MMLADSFGLCKWGTVGTGIGHNEPIKWIAGPGLVQSVFDNRGEEETAYR